MSTEPNNSSDKKLEPKFDEERAYFELCQIFAEAIQTQNFSNIEARINSWREKYPIDDFLNPYIIAKIKRILSREYLEHLLGKYLTDRIFRENQKQEKAFNELKEIIERAKKEKNFDKAESEIAIWRKSHSLYSFDRIYRAKVCRLISKDYISYITEKQKRDDAIEEFGEIKTESKNYNSSQLKEKIDEWMRKYPVEEFHSEYNREISSLVTESLELTTEKLTEEAAISEVSTFLEDAKKSEEPVSLDTIPSILSKYRTDEFSDEAKKQISSLTAEVVLLANTTTLVESEEPVQEENDDTSETIVEVENTTSDEISELNQEENSATAQVAVPTEVEASSEQTTVPAQEEKTIPLEVTILTQATETLDSTPDATLPSEENLSVEEITRIKLARPEEIQACAKFKKILDEDPHNITNILGWVYEYRNVDFSDVSKEQLVPEFSAAGYSLPKKANYNFEKLEDKEESISYEDYNNIDTIRTDTVSNYFAMLFYGHDITTAVQDGIEDAYIMSRQAQAIDFVNEEVENDEIFIPFAPSPVMEEAEEEIEKEEPRLF